MSAPSSPDYSIPLAIGNTSISGKIFYGADVEYLNEITYKGVTLEKFVDRKAAPTTAPLLIAPGMRLSGFCDAFCALYFGTLPFCGLLKQILMPWFQQQTEPLAALLKISQVRCVRVLLSTLPESEILIDTETDMDRRQIIKKIKHLLPTISTEHEMEVARIVIGAYGCLESVIKAYICDEDTYSRAVMRRICNNLYTMRDDFPSSVIWDADSSTEHSF